MAAVTAQEVITPNFGLEQNPEVLTLSPQAQTTIPANGVDGAVNIASQFAKVGPGTFASTDIRYNEVGTAIFRAFVESQDYLGSGPLESNSEPIGRFIPWKFEIRNSSVAAGCQDTDEPFTYLSQPITFDAAVVAINRDLQRTMNYPDTGSGVSVGISAADTVQQQDLSSRIETRWHQPDWQHGKGYLTSRQFSVNRLTGFQPEGPFESVAFALFIDGMNTDEGLYSPAHDADFSETDWDCQNNDNCYAVLLDEPSQFLFGQLLLENTYGSEWDALPVAVEAQYYNGQRFIKNTADNCTKVDYHNLSLIDPPAQLSTIIPMGLPGPLAVEKGINIPRSLMLSPPGAAGDVQITYQAPPWLGVAEEPEQNPKAFATFGVYGGHDRIINWQEIYNQ